MSQIHITATNAAGDEMEIQTGWDHLGGYYLVIEGLPMAGFTTEACDEDEGLVYSNLLDPALKDSHGLPNTYTHFEAILLQLGIVLTQEITDKLNDHKANNVGNNESFYDLT